jgi:hypothetical protein
MLLPLGTLVPNPRANVITDRRKAWKISKPKSRQLAGPSRTQELVNVLSADFSRRTHIKPFSMGFLMRPGGGAAEADGKR